jgi:hypothetical protein
MYQIEIMARTIKAIMILSVIFCIAKVVIRLKRIPTEWQKMFANSSFDKGLLISRLYRKLTTQSPKNQHHNEEMDT